MKVAVINKTEFQQFIDTGGVGLPEDIVPIAPKEKLILEFDNEKVFIKNVKKFKDKLIIRKI